MFESISPGPLVGSKSQNNWKRIFVFAIIIELTIGIKRKKLKNYSSTYVL
jgi:hypothetical protein